MQNYSPPMIPFLEILYADEAMIIANKQSGLLSVPGRGEDKKDCLLSRVQTKFPTALTVHRLDMQTSGLIIFALNKKNHAALSRLFESRMITKRYCAWVDGSPKEDNGSIDFPILLDWPNRPLQKIDYETGKPSHTQWQVIKREKEKTYLSLSPLTGRSHQLRIHLKEIGHPILGDPLYGTIKTRDMAPRLQLHAEFLSFIHPGSGEPFTITSPPPF
ncbi:MAG: pseudouridine synthase, partial [Sneathiella sp.]